jgi:hypothetical protein
VLSQQQIIDAILPWKEEVTLNAVSGDVSRICLKLGAAGVAVRTGCIFGSMLEAGC